MEKETTKQVADQMIDDLVSQIAILQRIVDAMLKDTGAIQVTSPDFDCRQSFNYTESSIHETGVFEKIDKSKPTIYWFQIVGRDNSSIIDALSAHKNKYSKSKVIPYLNESEAKVNDTSILYIGKVKKEFDTRLMQHLGFKISDTTQGLRFCEWAGNIHQEIKLHYIQFNQGEGNVIADLMSYFEYRLACSNKPLIGKHT